MISDMGQQPAYAGRPAGIQRSWRKCTWHRTVRSAFAGVRWGGPHARADTLAGLGGLRVAELAELSDIDSGADLARWRAGKNRSR